MQEFIKLKMKASSNKKHLGMLSPQNLTNLMKACTDELDKLSTTPGINIHENEMPQYFCQTERPRATPNFTEEKADIKDKPPG